jgi:hypothetical protein
MSIGEFGLDRFLRSHALRSLRDPIALRSFTALIVCTLLVGCGEDDQRIADMKKMGGALEKYFADHKNYPAPPAGPCDLKGYYNNLSKLDAALVPKYIDAVPKDSNPRSCVYNYFYTASGDGQNYAILGNIGGLDPQKYGDHWCIGASGGSPEKAGTGAFKACP